ncbi:MAG: transporter substrate-binding domain-containing protein [Balneolaceae bacterium]|nr:transporter substrate-binding domain-containing protein [Balneolaceae bacterium]MBO6545279.1 transporter substrate-binding domain-containing protein [Balneolaceae bacterium]MBO6646675.1 transporter substrate-binding domain-containing protein [Balneolaceae bacterium]
MLHKDNISIKNKRVIALFLLSVFFLSCFEGKKEPTTIGSSELTTTVTEPVSRDLTEIKQSGVLRMITSYSSGAYFLYRGIQVGFEYEMLKEFARKNDLALEVVIPGENENPYDLLNSGAGDIIAANYTITPEREEIVSFTRPYNLVNQIIVVSDELGFQPESITDLGGIPITIRRNSSYYLELKELQDQGFDIQINLVSEEMDTETLLFQVASGNYVATVADDNIFYASNKYMRGLVKGPVISERDEIAWAIRKNGSDLEARLNRFLYQHFKYDENGVPKRSTFLNVLRKKYYEGSSQIADYFNPELQTTQFGAISPYDSLIQTVADEFGLDWVMLTAIAAQESKFDPYSESWAGAVGIMQVLPRFSEVPKDSLYIPEHSIREGARIINEHLDHYSYLDSTNQWQLALATYNAGMGHVADARRLSIDQNKNPNEWSTVSESLLKLMQRRYYQHARYGFCRGIETVRYVNEIMNRYNTYQAILALAETRSMPPGVFGIKTLN